MLPTNSRACAVCSGVVRYGCAPALRCAASFSTFGPNAATTRRLVGTFAASSASRYSTNTSYGLRYSSVCSGWPMPMPSRKRVALDSGAGRQFEAKENSRHCRRKRDQRHEHLILLYSGAPAELGVHVI